MADISFLEIFKNLPEAVCTLSANGKFIAANKLFEETIVNLKRGGNYVFSEDLVHPEDKPMFLAAVSEAKNGIVATCKALRTLTCGTSNDFPIYRRYNWFLSGGLGEGKLILSGKMVTVVDSEEDVEGEFLDFFQKAPIALHWLSGTGHILWANDTELQVLGYTAEEYIGQPVMKFCPDEEELVLEIFKQLGSGNTIKDVPVRFRTKTGEIKHLLIDSNVNWNADGSFRHTRCFIRDDTGRKIREAIAAAEKATATKTAAAIDGCLRRVINQIRKQLYTTQDYMHTLLENGSPQNSPRQDIRAVESQMERMMGNLDDLAFATMCENGHVIALKPVPIQLDMMIRNIFAKLAYGRRSDQRVELDLKLNDVPNDILVDASVTRVMHHLISNAITYSTNHSVVTVEVSFTPVTSNGVMNRRRVLPMHDNSQRRGIFTFYVTNPVEQAMDLDVVYSSFQKYYSSAMFQPKRSVSGGSEPGSGSPSIQSQGLGVGLNVAYNMIQMMGGTLECSATDTESRFWFSLDLAYDPPGSRGANLDATPLPPFSLAGRKAGSPVDESGSKWTTVQQSKIAEHYLHKEDLKQFEEESLGGADGQVQLNVFQTKKRILIVDDSTICQRVLIKVVKRLGLDCDVASNGREAIEKLSSVPLLFDAVLMDVQMPIMDGITAIKALRSELRLTIPVVVLTADVSESAREDTAIAAGANAYLNKPATLNEIKGTLKRLSVV